MKRLEVTLMLIAALLIVSLVLCECGFCGWPETGNPVCTAERDQFEIQMISDGAGGAIIVWSDGRSNVDYDIYAQRISGAGVIQWMLDGVAVCAHQGNQTTAQLISDGAGGAIITWEDYRNGNQDIYAQRVDSEGVVLWVQEGVPICTTLAYQIDPRIVADGVGGVVVTWRDSREGRQDFYSQRVNSSGIVQWGAGGVFVSTGASYGEYPANSWKAVSDGTGGTIVAWNDSRNENWDVYAARVDSDGNVGSAIGVPEPRWSVTGFAIPQSFPNPFNPLCTVPYELPRAGRVSLNVFAASGSHVRTLVDDWREAGPHTELWDGRSDDGKELPSGVYFYRLEAGDFVATRKMVLLR